MVQTAILNGLTLSIADTQSVSVNVGAKDIKQEINQDSSQGNCNGFMTNNNVPMPNAQYHDDNMGDVGLSSLINDTDLEVNANLYIYRL